MNLKQIIKKYTWLNIETLLLELYPDEEHNIESYEEVYQKLIFMSPKPSDIMLRLSWEHDEFDGTPYVSVDGRDMDPDADIPYFTDSCAIEFTPWEEWLGMEITEETLASFTELEILCHSLWEMTFVDFDEEIIQEELQNLNDTVNDLKNMDEEERAVSTRTIEDFLNEMGEEID